MEIYGSEHSDDDDCSASFSSMTSISQLPGTEGWQGGRFHLLALGFYVRLVRWRVIYFSEQLRHGGTAPLAPKGEAAPPGIFRVVLIGYPPETIIQGQVRHALAAMPFTAEPLWISQEMTNVMYVAQGYRHVALLTDTIRIIQVSNSTKHCNCNAR